MSSLKLEVFKSTKPLNVLEFYCYKANSHKPIDTIQQFMRSVKGKISFTKKIDVFTDDRRIYTFKEIPDLNVSPDFTITFEKKEILSIKEYTKVYADVVDGYIKKNLSSRLQNYGDFTGRKYKISDVVSSSWIPELKSQLVSNSKDFRLRRDYDYRIVVNDDGYAFLYFNVSAEFESRKTICDLLNANRNVLGMRVTNNWSSFGQSGVIKEVGPERVTDVLPDFMPLKEYYKTKTKEKRIDTCPDDSFAIKVQMNNGRLLLYYPQALVPVITLERIAELDPDFSKRVEKYTKLDMAMRKKLAISFLSDIGCIAELGDIEFSTKYVDSKELNFSEKNFSMPKLICGNNKAVEYNKQSFVFANGFYSQPEETVKLAYFYPQGKHDLMSNFAKDLTGFLNKGELFSSSQYLIPELLKLDIRAVCHEEYEIGNITNYKDLVREVSEKNKFDIAIVIVPTEEDEDNPYSTFKTEWAKQNIPSQMISVKTAEMFARKENNARYYMQNIALGVFAKVGGIPWIVDNIPGDVDCFIGMDVATLEKGIHYPTCATVFDKNGRPISFYKPRLAQKGEKIETKILQEIFDEVILSYQHKYSSKPKKIVIHRDGFSNEDAVWYENYFLKQQIEYSVIEVKKYISSKMLCEDNGMPRNPESGCALFNDEEAFIVTTDIKDGRASPRPLHIRKLHSTIPMEQIIKQILALSCMHFGATKKSRLPVTTYYADRICKNIDYVPEGQFGNKLFFL